jgi:hypothetical protein
LKKRKAHPPIDFVDRQSLQGVKCSVFVDYRPTLLERRALRG